MLSQNDVQKLQRMWNWFQKNETKINKPRPIYPRMLGGGGGAATGLEVKIGKLIDDIDSVADPLGVGSLSVYDGELNPPVQTAETLVVVWDWMRDMHGGSGTLLKGAECGAIKFREPVAAKPQWQPTTNYTEGEQVSQDRISDAVEFNWSSNTTRTSGTTWDAAEEAEWTIVDQVDATSLWRLMWWVVLGIGKMKIGDTFRVG